MEVKTVQQAQRAGLTKPRATPWVHDVGTTRALKGRDRNVQMAQSLAQILVHVIFSTKKRYPFLDVPIRPELHAYAATVLKKLDSPALLINSVSDHIHILCRLSKKLAISDLVEEVKTSTSKWIKTKAGMLRKFYWQSGYGAFSVSPSQVATVCRYIENQEKHHRRVTFQDELRRFLRRHGVEYDERYVWD